MASYTLTPAYGRDYKSKADATFAFEENLDFIDQSFDSQWAGKPINRSQIAETGGGTVKIRYAKLRREVIVNVPAAQLR